ncbi:MAG: long-chain fatty acid--CoA ligase [Gammaproteobacteria bacterium]|jgi:acyl-CoA synthetase (AMP-forming)/AMP-acid ligase II|nr:long-chain fatty acid--CoA ligase [Gammaproteobacteria bacterium]MCH1551238.1 long-chain fatty acid--CoA ligase [Pseudomonadales bacterium]
MAMQHTPLLMHTILDRGAKVAPNEEIVTATEHGVRRQTYRQTRDRAHQLAHALKAAGIAVGDRVGTFMWNGSRHLEAYHACAGMGAVLHTLNIRLSAKDLEYIIGHAQDKIIIVDADALPLLEVLKDRMPSVQQVVVATEEGFEGWQTQLPNPIDYEAFIDGHPADFDWPVIDENSSLGLCYTSGTTGNPKGVEYEHRSQYLHTMAQAMTDSMGLSATDTLLGIVPMFHAMGWGLPWTALMLGCKQVLPHRFMDPQRLLDLLQSEGVTLSAGVPTIWQGIKGLYESDPAKYDLSSLSRLTCGGSSPPPSLIRWYWDTLNVEMIQGWGMTETSPLATLSRRVMKRSQLSISEDQQFANVAKAGQVIPGIELEIFDEDFQPLPHDGETVGEILVRGPWICSEYYNNPQPEKFHDGWLITGDVGKIDSEEYLIISDRSKDLVKSGGEWISSVDLENHIVALDGVSQACVVAQPHPKWDERPIALVVLEAGRDVAVAQVMTHCEEAFAKWQLPDDVLYVDSIPLTSTGKMDKKVVRARLEQEGYTLPSLRD